MPVVDASQLSPGAKRHYDQPNAALALLQLLRHFFSHHPYSAIVHSIEYYLEKGSRRYRIGFAGPVNKYATDLLRTAKAVLSPSLDAAVLNVAAMNSLFTTTALSHDAKWGKVSQRELYKAAHYDAMKLPEGKPPVQAQPQVQPQVQPQPHAQPQPQGLSWPQHLYVMEEPTRLPHYASPSHTLEYVTFYEKTDPWYMLTNFWEVRGLQIDGRTWPSTEHYFQAQKLKNTANAAQHFATISTMTPGQAFAYARTVQLTPAERQAWDKGKYGVMLTALRAKFSPRHPILMHALLATGNAHLVEVSHRDQLWGVGVDRATFLNNPGAYLKFNRTTNVPENNWLGAALMQVRSELKAGSS